MLASGFELPVFFDLGATFAFALSGALAAIKRDYDIVGVLALAVVSGIGGGLIRDGLFLNQGSTPLLTNPNYRAIGVGRAYSESSSYRNYWVMDVGGIVDAAIAVPNFDLGYHAGWAGQSPDVTLSPGQTATMVVAFRNLGYRGWYRGYPGQQANLGTADPLDAQRWDLMSGWPSASRIATTTTAYVGPGQVGWFQFQVRAPSSAGLYVLRVRGVIDGATWLEDPGVYWTITVR